MQTQEQSKAQEVERPPFGRVLNPGSGEYGLVFVRVKFQNERLSLCGVEGPRPNGDARGSCGQIGDHLNVTRFAAGWDAEQLARLVSLWDRWHLNDLRAGCEHQRANWDVLEKLEIVSYGLTTDAHSLRLASLERAGKYAANGQTPDFNALEKALLGLARWFEALHTPPDADSPLSGCYKVKKRETKTAGWVYPKEHPKGLLCKPCEVCGYRYGSAWLFERVPELVIDELLAFPVSTVVPAWV